MSKTSKSVISTNLDKKSLSQALERGEFEDYSERFADMDDGVHDYKEQAESFQIKTEIKETQNETNDIIVPTIEDIDNINPEKEIAFEPNTKKSGTPQSEPYEVEEIFRLAQEMQKNKKGFTVEDMIAKNFQQLLYEKKEFVEDENGKLKRTKQSWFQLLFNSATHGFSFINYLVGAGILSLAQSCRKMGIIGFVLWLLGTSVYYFVTWHYYNRAIYLTGSATMGEIFSLILGKPFAFIIDLFQSIFNFCYLFCYQVISTQFIFSIFQNLMPKEKWPSTMESCYGNPQRTIGIECSEHFYILLVVALCFNLPLILPKSIRFLNKISFISVIAATTTSIVVFGKTIYFAAKGESSNGKEGVNIPSVNGKWGPSDALTFFTMAPFITSNFNIHACIPPMFAASKGLSKKTTYRVIYNGSTITNVLSCTLITIIAVSGNIAFDEVGSNILNSFVNSESKEVDVLIIICRILMTINVMLSYPGVTYPTYACMIRYFPKRWKIMQYKDGYFAGLLFRLCLWVCSTACACFIIDIGVVFSIISSIFVVPILYIGPLTIMMLWPRFELFGNPKYRKLSVIDNIIYNKSIQDNDDWFFTDDEVNEALNNENNENNENQSSVSSRKSNNNETNEDGIEMENENNSNENKNEVKIKMPEKILRGCQGDELMKNRKKRFIKLPDAPVPKWRYIVFGSCMIIIVILCIVSIVGTIIGEVKK